MAWVVFATAPAKNWVYQPNHFPRSIHYKKEAIAKSEGAKREGGINVFVVNESDLPKNRLPSSPKTWILRCERENTIFYCSPPERLQTKNYDPDGDRCINCPVCSRGYYYMGNGKWQSDRDLTVLHQSDE